MHKYYHCYNSPVGDLLLIGSESTLEELYLGGIWGEKNFAGCTENHSLFSNAISQLDEYFSGKRKIFNLNLQLNGTDFQKTVWQALTTIPYGSTTSYGEIAKQIGNPKGTRAVGLANNRNPIPIIIPCHRVIGKDGSLTGYGGGVEVKQQLLDLEQKYF